MKQLFFAFIVTIAINAHAQNMVMTDETTQVTFASTHLLGKLEGNIRGVNGTANFDSANLESSFLKLSLDAATLLHNDPHMGPDLFKKECLNVKEFPTINLASTSIAKTAGAGHYQFTGTLTVKGITKKITFPFTATPNVGGYDFSFSFPVNKKMYDIDCAFRKKITFNVKGYGKRV